MSIHAKRLYERMVLNNYAPTEEERKMLEGTRWKHKLEGKTGLGAFKTHYVEEALPEGSLSRSQTAAHVSHYVEERYQTHFTDKINESLRGKLPEIKAYAANLIQRMNTDEGDKASLINSINKARDLSELMIRLNLAASTNR